MSENLEAKMSSFKEHQMLVFDRIAAEEEEIEADLDLFNERLVYYENPRFAQPE